jgi:3-deoxy-D-manno-octulosonic-acid transferase
MSSDFKPTIKQQLALTAYTLTMALISPLLILHTFIKTVIRSEGYNQRKLERFGIIKGEFKPHGIWVHCVSVGEVATASFVIEKLLIEDPQLIITVTTTTHTGSQRVSQRFGDRVQHCYLPYDFSIFVRLTLAKIKPTAVLITEVELWPTLIHQCWKKDIPALVINARMTDRSIKGYQKVSALFTPMLNKLSLVCAQGTRDFNNYLELGIPKTKLTLTNNIKFDIDTPTKLLNNSGLSQQYNPRDRLIFLAGSTHDPEESIVLDAFEACLSQHSNLRLLLIPRHPQRFDTVYQLCRERNLITSRASEGIDEEADIILVDEMGVLSQLYQLARFAFVGGSIAPRGGHNALEAAIYSVPMMMGSSTYNNPDICQVLKDAGAMTTTNTVDDMQHTLSRWLSNPNEPKLAGEKGKEAIEINAGAVDNTIRSIRQFVPLPHQQ